ncbi:MAG TPA: RNA polymerase sigma factor [Solirubrobacteraceae bacterium]|nr:RNA polymerase sigma factor [Solirubrobacteraceae bacterium]
MPPLDPASLPKHTDRLFRAAWALTGSREDAQDLVQETFARVLARPRMLHGQDELAYLLRVLRNTFLTQRRTASRRPQISGSELEELEPEDPRTGDRPEQAVETRELISRIANLSEDHRLALVAVDVLGLSYREAAQALRTREATIATRVFRARQRIARELGDGSPAAQRPGGAPAERGNMKPEDGNKKGSSGVFTTEGPT